MRVAQVVASALILLAGHGAAQAVDAPFARTGFEGEKPPIPVGLRGGFLSEARFGVFSVSPFAENSWDAVAVQGEVLFARPITTQELFASYFVPRPHLGGALNLSGGINYAFAGLTWTLDLTPAIFVEASIGGALQQTRASAFAPDTVRRGVPAGCAPSLREAAAIGYRLNESWSFVASVEHLSNSGVCAERSSMTNFGARLGYSF
ncbi:acyloxyacyl hydrolase [Salinarimonas sp.]|uniref:acyloxyacyl hydrolase n=1 Tax=Salinarimonas sp. TaxID=2766526 RepID=UPI003919C9AA